MNIKTTDIGVIVGRFQTNDLHEGHREIIQQVIDNHDKVIIFLGISQAINTKRNPLDFITRKAMIEEIFPFGISAILPLLDKYSDLVWSKQIDNKVREVFPSGSVTLYGSRDSCLFYYLGKFKTIELKPTVYSSATSIREKIAKKTIRSSDFRAADNLLTGSGGGLLEENLNRDTNRFAIKVSYAEMGGKSINVSKSPKTDGSKASKSGKMKLHFSNNAFITITSSEETEIMFNSYVDSLQTVYENGNLLVDENFSNVRKRAMKFL